MADSELTPAHIILLAVQNAIKADIKSLRTLVSRHRKTLHNILTFRILLTYLPETLETHNYVGFLQDLSSGALSGEGNGVIDTADIEQISPGGAAKKVKKL